MQADWVSANIYYRGHSFRYVLSFLHAEGTVGQNSDGLLFDREFGSRSYPKSGAPRLTLR